MSEINDLIVKNIVIYLFQKDVNYNRKSASQYCWYNRIHTAGNILILVQYYCNKANRVIDYSVSKKQ